MSPLTKLRRATDGFLSERRKMQPISEIVKVWCEDRNANSGANRCFLALLLVLFACFKVFLNGSDFWPFLAACVVFLFWLLVAPKPIKYGQLRFTHRNWFVEDSLLVRLAESQEIPEWIKTAIANELEKNRRITFDSLFQIEGWIECEERQKRVEQQDGFQKMVAFSQKRLGR